MRDSYGEKSPGLRAVNATDSLATFNFDAKLMTLRDANNSTFKLDATGKKTLLGAGTEQTPLPHGNNDSPMHGSKTSNKDPASPGITLVRRGASATTTQKEIMPLQNELA